MVLLLKGFSMTKPFYETAFQNTQGPKMMKLYPSTFQPLLAIYSCLARFQQEEQEKKAGLKNNNEWFQYSMETGRLRFTVELTVFHHNYVWKLKKKALKKNLKKNVVPLKDVFGQSCKSRYLIKHLIYQVFLKNTTQCFQHTLSMSDVRNCS